MNEGRIPVVRLNQEVVPLQDRTKETNGKDNRKLLLLHRLPLRLRIIDRMRDPLDDSIAVGIPVDQTTANPKDRR
jgi:hypothetical protein